MFRSFFKLLLFVILMTLVIVSAALVAAPYFVRQDQVKAFIEENITLPDNKKLVLEGDIDFGLFPYMYFETKKVDIKGEGVPTQTFENVKVGFDFNDLFGKGVDFDIRTKYMGIAYEANVDIRDYKSFYQQGKTPVVIKAAKPISFSLKGDLAIDGKKRSFKNFIISHKKTTVKGTINHELTNNKNQKIDGNVVIDTDNIDDLRRLAFFEKYYDKFNLLDGIGKVVLGFDTKGYDDYTFRKNLNAEGSFKLENVNVYGFDLEEIARNPLEVKFKEDYSRKITIDDASGLFTVDKGLMSLKDTNANSQRLKLKTKGLINLAEENLNLDADLDLDMETNKLDVPLKIKGSFEKPKITPRYDEAIMKNLPTLLQNKIDSQNLGKDLLQGGSGDLKQIEDDLKNNIKNIFKGF